MIITYFLVKRVKFTFYFEKFAIYPLSYFLVKFIIIAIFLDILSFTLKN